MAKKIYHIPLQKTLVFIKHKKDTLLKLAQDKTFLELNKLIGKAFYTVELDKFMNYFKILKDTKYTLATLEFFNSTQFIDTAFTHLSLKQLEVENNPINTKDFFYAFLNILQKEDNKLFTYFLEKLFIHYHKSFVNATNINTAILTQK